MGHTYILAIEHLVSQEISDLVKHKNQLTICLIYQIFLLQVFQCTVYTYICPNTSYLSYSC